ncbi:hypothetical protein CLI75_10380 [Porphyromonas gingivalis]|uniref:hypothetical protein n=1 Tax=Porphyromonas gingivalis TaxID=837 RepID=UPI000BE76DF2|nr:hypothetical protein [Porphyromonas gingivalis]ATS06620.1 hypothetical protein CS387_06345 [Porphyromonas gingivalis]MCE8171956.1 hypothetical protein [Porphyromonas gingivalis]MCE8194392.1 hypothetical protein [Porphyromonas gingivalis]PDP55264.1 hypothetical protein CLI75_10380 [Porphyromonas gingivalis]RZQ69598.1 hypothetical protein EW638_02710 [Porphyromonas gingivalis]
MKQLFLALCMSLIFNNCLIGQEKLKGNISKDILDCLTEVGKDAVSTLNVCESKYLNCRFHKDKNTFDFYSKKVAFLKGNAGTIKSTKKDFFEKEKYFIEIKGFFTGSAQLIVFNDDEERQVGYDAVIVSSSKRLLTKEEVVKRLKKKH